MNGIKRLALSLIVFGAAVLPRAAAADGPKVTVIGDSYSTFSGTMPEGYDAYYPGNGVTTQEQMYWQIFINYIGGTLVHNNSWAGTYVCGSSESGSSFISKTRLEAMPDDTDVFVVFGGTNDSWNNKTLGGLVYSGWTEGEKGEFAPAYCYLLDYLRTHWPFAKIVLVINSTDDGNAGIKATFAEKMVAAAAHYRAIAVQCSGITKPSGSRHPNAAGMATIAAQMIAAWDAAYGEDGTVTTYADDYIETTIDNRDVEVAEIGGGMRAYIFKNTTPGQFTTLESLSLMRLLLVGGGGAGGTTIGGGGGGGEVKVVDTTTICEWSEGTSASVTVGVGGSPYARCVNSQWDHAGHDGMPTAIEFGASSFTALGGGGGGSFSSKNGQAGASGGGSTGGGSVAGGEGLAGYAGGSSVYCNVQNCYGAGGGGGASEKGADGDVKKVAGRGGEGVVSNISGEDVVYGSGGGGGGGNGAEPANGGTNAGDGGENTTDQTKQVYGEPGMDGTGSGGGGGGFNGKGGGLGGLGGKGGDGVAIFVFAPSGSSFSFVEPPTGLSSQTFQYDGLSHRPEVAAGEGYQVDYGAGDWTEAGVYTLTVSLADKENTLWSDWTGKDRVYTYHIKLPPTTTTGTRVEDTTVVESWGESYILCDDVSQKYFQIVRVTNTASAATWTVPAGVFVEYLVVGGGGAGGWTVGGGGGGGGVITDVLDMLPNDTEFTMTVGAGGLSVGKASSPGGNSSWKTGVSGTGSSLKFGTTTVETHGGGGGAGWDQNSDKGLSGASSGGNTHGQATVATTTLYPGELGNLGGASSSNGGAGGGGATEAGGNGTAMNGTGGKGGEGYGSFITGERVVYGSGGGGGRQAGDALTTSAGGTNGGSGGYAAVLGGDGVTNTGGGGGGGGYNGSKGSAGGDGASGVVILRYQVAPPPHYAKVPGGLQSQELGYTGWNQRPEVEESDDFEITYSVDGDWIEVGVYTVTLSLVNPTEVPWQDETVADKVFTYTIVKAENGWVVEPTLSKDVWQVNDEPGLLSIGEARFGEVEVEYSNGGTVMPTEVGAYSVSVGVAEGDNYHGITNVLYFTIQGDGPIVNVEIPSSPWAGQAEVPYDAADHRPEVAEGDDYSVSFSADRWIEAGTYWVKFALKDRLGHQWADGSVGDIVYMFTIAPPAVAVTLGEPVKEGKEITGYNLNFTAPGKSSAIYVVWGEVDHGGRVEDWANVELVNGKVAAAATSATVPVPEGWSKEAKFLRYILVPAIRQLEYITGTGAQYIDTGLKPSGYVKTTIEASLSEKTAQQRLFGTAITDAPIPSDCLEYELYISGASSAPGYICRVGSASWANTGHGTWSINTRYTWMMDAATAKLHEPAGDFSCSWSGDRTTAKAYNNLYLFTTGRVPSQSDMIAHGNIYTATVYDRVEGVDTLLRDYLPAEVGGVAGLWDNVEKEFYPSAGTGDFAAGPEAAESTLVLPESPLFSPDGISPLIKFNSRTGMIIYLK